MARSSSRLARAEGSIGASGCVSRCPCYASCPFNIPIYHPGSSAQIHREEQEAERPKAARVSKSDVESSHGVRVPVCLMAALRKSTVLTDSSLPLVVLLHLSSVSVWRCLQDVSKVHANKAERVCDVAFSSFYP